MSSSIEITRHNARRSLSAKDGPQVAQMSGQSGAFRGDFRCLKKRAGPSISMPTQQQVSQLGRVVAHFVVGRHT